MKLNQDFLEKIIIRAIMNDSVFLSRIIEKIDANIFSKSSYGKIVKFYKDFWKKHSKLPSLDELKLFAADNDFLQSLKITYDDTKNVDLHSIDKNILYAESEKFLKEKLALLALNDIVDKLTANKVTAEEIVNRFEKITNISLLFEKGFNIYDDVERYINNRKTNIARLETGFTEIDKNIGGGVPSDGKFLGIITAPTNMGKSVMLGNIAVNAAKAGKNVLIISLEMSEEVYATRVYSALYDMPINSLDFLGEELRSKINEKRYGNVIIKEFPPATMTVDQIDGYIEELYKAGHKFDLVCVDYLTLLAAPGADNSNEAGKTITRKLRALTYKYNIPFWTACQINREGMGVSSPDIRHIAESIAIASEADLILSLYQEAEDADMNIMRLSFLKSRLGRNGFSINLFFNHENLRFESMQNTSTDSLPTEERRVMEVLDNVLTLEQIIESAS